MKLSFLSSTLLAVSTLAASYGVVAQTTIAQTTTLRATDLRADKLGSSAIVASLASGAVLRVLSLEGGWAWVESADVRGWVRANTLNLQSGEKIMSPNRN